MAKKETELFVIFDRTDNSLLDTDIYGSEKDAVDWAKGLVNDSDDSVTLWVCKLTPATKISKSVNVERI